MVYFPNVDPTYIHKRQGTEEDPYIPVEDSNNIRNNVIVMKEIPSFNSKVVATIGDTELNEVQTSPSNPNEFRVDYTTGVAYFHSSQNSKLATLKYLGTGYVSIPASRVWIVGESGDPNETLEQALDRVDEGIQVLDSISEFKFQGLFSLESQYDKWNFTFYKNKTYVALENSINEYPDTSSKWRLVSSGVGFAGVYDDSKSYNVGDIVSDPNLKNIFFSKIDNNNNLLDDTDAWELMLTMDDIVELMGEKINELNDFSSFLEANEEERQLNEENRQGLFEQTLLDVESITDIIQSDESLRDLNESQREANEENRMSFEAERQIAESQRKENELERENAFLARESIFEQLSIDIDNAIDTAVVSIGNANKILNETKDSVTDALNNLEGMAVDLEGEVNRLINFRYLGEFVLDYEYKKENIVSYNGSTYIALKDTVGNDVENVEYWGLIAKRGLGNIDIAIDGVSPDVAGNISLEELDIVRNVEFDERSEYIDEIIGEMDALNTLHKTSLVGAINELKKRIDDIIAVLD